MPQLDGDVVLKKLSQEVQVKRDRFGIPHIFAQNTIDAYRTLGYTIASERLFQMEVQRRMAYGELSEIFGEKALPSDKLFRTLGLKSFIQNMLANKLKNHQIDFEMWQRAEAFYDGINQFQEKGALPIEFKFLNIVPRPFTINDGYAFMGLMSFSFAIATSQDPLFSQLKLRFSDDLYQTLRNEMDMAVKIIPKKVSQGYSVEKYPAINSLSYLESGFPLFEGSNGWVISGSRTKSGRPILANDPHITFSHPGIWFEAHISSPQYEMYGHFLSIIPFPVLGHNKDYGWGLTMSLIDDMDLYKEQIDPKFKSYMFKGNHIPYNERFEKIVVKKSKPFDMVVTSTHHGPILDYVLTDPANKSIALNWSFLSPQNDPLTALYKMGTAQNMTEFKSAVSLGVAPGLNVIYADKKNIAWWLFGELRKHLGVKPADMVLDGSSGNDEQVSAVAFDEKPHLENPISGYIVSANSKPEHLPNGIRGDWQPDDRYKTLNFLLGQNDKMTVADNMKIQTMNFNIENKLILPALLENLDNTNLWVKSRSKQYVNLLKKWDYLTDESSIAATIYYTWCKEVTRLLLHDLSKNELETFYKLPNSWIFFKRVILDSNSPWWKKYDKQKLITQAFNSSIEALREQFGDDYRGWQWGHSHTLEFVHPIGRLKPLDLVFNIGPVGIGGAYNEVNNQKHSGFLEGFRVKAGPSTRRIIDFSSPERAYGILPTGNSAHIFSSFYRDQLPLYLKGKYRNELLSSDDIELTKTHELIFHHN